MLLKTLKERQNQLQQYIQCFREKANRILPQAEIERIVATVTNIDTDDSSAEEAQVEGVNL